MRDRRKADEGNSGKQIVWFVGEKRNMRVKTREQNNRKAEDGVPGMDLGAEHKQ